MSSPQFLAQRRAPVRLRRALCLLFTLVLAGVGGSPFSGTGGTVEASRSGTPSGKGGSVPEIAQLSETARSQIVSLLAEKASRSAAQMKIDSQLLFAARIKRGAAVAEGVPDLLVGVSPDESGLYRVDIRTTDVTATETAVLKSGGRVERVSKAGNGVRARLPIEALEPLAEKPFVRFITPPSPMFTQQAPAPDTPRAAPAGPAEAERSAARVAAFRQRLAAMVRNAGATSVTPKKEKPGAVPEIREPHIGNRNSQGDVTHRANAVRATFGIDGTGMKIGVISDSFDNRAGAGNDILSGDLPGPGNPNGYTRAVRFAGQGDLGDGTGSDEGRAMLQIVHDLAPGAELWFADSGNGPEDFANNICALSGLETFRGAPVTGTIVPGGCDIVIDDIFYLVETPLHKGQAQSVISPNNMGIITEAVNTVTSAGKLYFSAAGNLGNITQNTGAAWEGDFISGGTLTIPGQSAPMEVLNWNPGQGGSQWNDVLGSGVPVLHWADPMGGSTNDYDLFVLNQPLNSVVASSTNVQNGAQDPIEFIARFVPAGSHVVVIRKSGAAARFLSFAAFDGRLQIATPGHTRGHATAENGFGVAATPAGPPIGDFVPAGPFPNPFVSTNQVEEFSSDGFRRVFFNADNTPITPGNFLASGGQVLQKPDITAADGVETTFPPAIGLNPFYGTSAAAPHAGAIAALIKQALGPGATPAQVRTILTSTALDIMGPGFDRNSGFGILQAFQAAQAAGATPRANVGFVAAVITTGNGILEPNECNALTITLRNTGAATATGIMATLTTNTAGVGIVQGTSGYADISPGGSGGNTAAFQINTGLALTCGGYVSFTLNVATADGTLTFPFELPVGQPGINYQFANATGTIPGGGVLIPGSQNDDVLVTIPLPPGFKSYVYDTPVTSLMADTNGNLRINGSGRTASQNSGFPATGTSAQLPTGTPILFPYWADLDMRPTAVTGGGIFTTTTGTAPNRQFWIEWRGELFDDVDTTINTDFAIVLTEGATGFSYVYALTGPPTGFPQGAAAVIGVQARSTGQSATLISFRQPTLTEGRQFNLTLPSSTCNIGTGGCGCTYSTSPPSLQLTGSGGTGTVTVTASGPTCEWAASSSVPWLSIESGATGSGNGTVTYRARLNAGVPRTGTLTVAGQTIQVTQSAKNGATPGQFRPSNGFVYIRNTNDTGFADREFFYGVAGDAPVAGDWDGDGADSIGIYRNGTFFLKNANNSGFADLQFPFGAPGDIPIAGDWDGDGVDTIGVVRGNTIFLRNSNTSGNADIQFNYGATADIYIAGDWNGDGIDTIGCFRPTNGFVYTRNVNSTGFADASFFYGLAGDRPVVGDWNADGLDTIGIVRGNQWFLRNSNSSGFADIQFFYGNDTDTPIAGDWNGQP